MGLVMGLAEVLLWRVRWDCVGLEACSVRDGTACSCWAGVAGLTLIFKITTPELPIALAASSVIRAHP